MTENRLKKAVGKLKRRLNLQVTVGYLGDGTGEVHDRNNPGRYFVRFPQADGSFASPVSIPAIPNANLPTTDGLPVDVGYDKNDRPIIIGVDLTALSGTDANPLQLNPLDQQASEFLDQTKLSTLYATRHADEDNLPFYAVVFPGLYFASGIPALFSGANIDLSSFQPAAGEHCYVIVFLKSDGTLEAFASTAKDVGDPLEYADVEEALALGSIDSIALKAWMITGDEDLLTVDENRVVDLRVTVSSSPGSGGADDTRYVSTAPATDARNVIQPTLATVKALIVKGAASQSDTLTEWQNSSGTVLASVDSTGLITASKTVQILGTADAEQLLVKGHSTQTNKILQIKNSANVTKFNVDASGTIEVAGNILPTTPNTTMEIGTTSVPVARIYLGTELRPVSNFTGSLGSFTEAFIDLHVYEYWLGGELGGGFSVPAGQGLIYLSSSDNLPRYVDENDVEYELLGANRALSNLTSVAINTTLVSDTDNTDDLGTASIKWRAVYTNLAVLEERTAPSDPATGDAALYAGQDFAPHYRVSLTQDYRLYGGSVFDAVTLSDSTSLLTLSTLTAEANIFSTKGMIRTTAFLTYFNNSGATRTLTFVYTFGSYTYTYTTGTIAASATNRGGWWLEIITYLNQAQNAQRHMLHVVRGLIQADETAPAAPAADLYAHGASAVTTTSDVTVSLTAQMSAATTAQTLTGVAEVDGPNYNA